MTKFLAAFIFASVFVACNGDKESGQLGTELKIETKNVSGTIQAPEGARTTPGTYNKNNVTTYYVSVKIGNNSLMIGEPYDSYENIKAEISSGKLKSRTLEVEIIEESDNHFMYKMLATPFDSGNEGEPKDGYGFVMKVNDGNKTYLLYSEGESMFDPIWDKSQADEMLKIAKTFKPS